MLFEFRALPEPVVPRNNSREAELRSQVRSATVKRGRDTHLVALESLRPAIQYAASIYGLSYTELAALAMKESGLRPDPLPAPNQLHQNFNLNILATSKAAPPAKGLLQLQPATFRKMGYSDIYDPIESLLAGAKYLRYLKDTYRGNYQKAVTAYEGIDPNVVSKPTPHALTVMFYKRQLERVPAHYASLHLPQRPIRSGDPIA